MNTAALRSAAIPSAGGIGTPRPTSARTSSRVHARFADDGHLRYYASCGMTPRRDEKKNLMGVWRDPFTLLSRAPLMEAAPVQAVERVITEEAEILLERVRLQRAEEKETRKMKKKAKAALKAARKRKVSAKEKSSSSSSSESCESEYDNKHEKSRFKMNNILRNNALLVEPKPEVQSPPLESLGIVTSTPLVLENEAPIAVTKVTEPLGRHSMSADATNNNSVTAGDNMNKIEVCMGGKCKKSGAPELLNEFERQVGVNAAVVQCKCMGKCKEGPNVRVVSQSSDADPLVKNPLCIGVGLQDVRNIVSQFVG